MSVAPGFGLLRRRSTTGRTEVGWWWRDALLRLVRLEGLAVGLGVLSKISSLLLLVLLLLLLVVVLVRRLRTVVGVCGFLMNDCWRGRSGRCVMASGLRSSGGRLHHVTGGVGRARGVACPF